jgi:inner membrane transporter RhtA
VAIARLEPTPVPLRPRLRPRRAAARVALGGGLPAPVLLLGAMLSIQCGAALASGLFGRFGVVGTTFLRTAVAAVVLSAIAPPALRGRSRRELAWPLAFGLVLAALNLSFLEALARLPLGVVVTVEFLGPLGLAVALSRRARDVLWVALAGGGVLLFAGAPHGRLDAAGLAFAAAAGVAWAAYVLLSQRVGSLWPGAQGLAAALLVSAVVLAPVGVPQVGTAVLHPGALLLAVALGVLSSALPFALELAALRRLPARAYGVLTSLEPAVASAVGLVVLRQRPGVAEALAALLVVAASIGAARGAAGS